MFGGHSALPQLEPKCIIRARSKRNTGRRVGGSDENLFCLDTSNLLVLVEIRLLTTTTPLQRTPRELYTAITSIFTTVSTTVHVPLSQTVKSRGHVTRKTQCLTESFVHLTEFPKNSNKQREGEG